jgi:diketogulonate reductase-like aldo/keto reductase
VGGQIKREKCGTSDLPRPTTPKSTKAHRIAENFDVFDFELDADELTAIDALDTGKRGGPEPQDVTLEAYGMPIPEAD